MRARRFVACLCLAIWAQGAWAFDYPELDGADPAHYAAAKGGDPYAGFSYVLPVLNQDIIAPEDWTEVRGWLDWLYGAFEAEGNAHGQAAVAANMAGRLVARQDFDDAIAWIRRCADHDEALSGEPRLYLSWCYDTAGTLFVQMALPQRAIEWHQRSIDIQLAHYDETDEQIYLEGALNSHGMATYAVTLSEDYENAIRYREEGLEMAQAHTGKDSELTAVAILNLATTLWYAGDFPQSKEWFDRGMPLIERHAARYDYVSVIARMNAALLAYDLGNLEEARTLALSIVPYLAANPELSLEQQRWTFQVLRKVYTQQGDANRAIMFGKLAVNAQQEIRARNSGFAEAEVDALRARWSSLYQELAALMIREGRFSEAQAVLNMEKEQEAFEFLKRDSSAALKETRAVLTDEELDETAQMNALAARPVAAYEVYRALLKEVGDDPTPEQDDQLFLLEDAMEEAEAAYQDSVDAFLAQVAEADRKGFEEGFDATGAYQDILQEKERPSAILQLAVLDEATHLFLTLPGATVHKTVEITRGDMRAQVFAALQAIERVDPDVNTALQGLHDLLLAPVREELEIAGTEVIMLNAGDVLRYVPFAALHDGTHYAVEDFAFAQYVAAVPTNYGRPDRQRASSAGFGVTQAHGGFDALPGVGFEIEALFTADDGQGVLEGQSALDEGFDARALRKVLRNPPELLHIASHFALAPGQIDDSFLLLGDGSELRLSEFGTRRFNLSGVDLLTLSACQTARGGDGSEIDGMGVAALQKGASAVMASLWPVADAATPILMRDFYEGLYGGGLDKAEALRAAQVAMLRDGGTATLMAMRAAAALEDAPEPPPQGFAHPYFWSAFIIMGNWL
ncbi:MAG: CHAT domain-containing protein [Pseudomonadota bacterium]